MIDGVLAAVWKIVPFEWRSFDHLIMFRIFTACHNKAFTVLQVWSGLSVGTDVSEPFSDAAPSQEWSPSVTGLMDCKFCDSRITRNVRNCLRAQHSAAPLRQLSISPTSCFLLHKFCSYFLLWRISIYFHNSTFRWQASLYSLFTSLTPSVFPLPSTIVELRHAPADRKKNRLVGDVHCRNLSRWIFVVTYLVINVGKNYWLQRYQVFYIFKPRRTLHILVNMPIGSQIS
jgi:hypothetical protein